MSLLAYRMLSKSSMPQTAQAQAESIECPGCGSSMVLRTATSGGYAGTQFLGCIRYPRCTWLANADGSNLHEGRRSYKRSRSSYRKPSQPSQPLTLEAQLEVERAKNVALKVAARIPRVCAHCAMDLGTAPGCTKEGKEYCCLAHYDMARGFEELRLLVDARDKESKNEVHG